MVVIFFLGFSGPGYFTISCMERISVSEDLLMRFRGFLIKLSFCIFEEFLLLTVAFSLYMV